VNDEAATDPDGIAERVIEALETYQQLSIDVIANHADNPEGAVKGLVNLHLDWTEQNRETAVLIAKHRNEVMAGPHRERLMASNREFFASMKAWIEREAGTGKLPAVSFNLMHAVVFAPAQEVAKLGLSGKLKKPLQNYADALGDAAWAGLKSLPERSRA